MKKPYRLAVFNSHPIQYFAPLYRRLAAEADIDLTVFYGSRQGIASRFDVDFDAEVVWDVPLLEGYRHEFLWNVGGDRGVGGFFSLINPSLASRIIRGNFDAVLVHGQSSASTLLAIASAKVSGTRVLMRADTHLLLARGALKAAIRRPVMTAFYKLCDACLYIGAWNRAFYEFHGVPDGKLFFVPLSVDNSRFEIEADRARSEAPGLRDSLGVRPDSILILFASKLISRKRPFDLLDAYEALLARDMDVELLFIGTGELEKSLRERVVARGLAGVHFRGFVNQKEMPAYFAAADIFVLPSEDEPWGLVINEAMSAGIPVVSTNEVGAAADLLVDGETGLVFPPGDIQRLEDCLAALALDPSLRKRIAVKARQFMSTWSYDQCVEGIRSALRAVVPKKS